MRLEHYERIMGSAARRRELLKGASGLGLVAALGGGLGALPGSTRPAAAQGSLRAEILKIPGVGMGSPTDADWQRSAR